MNELIIDNQTIQDKIYTIRDVQVMVDRDLALLYGVETRRLNEQVKRNIERFPQEFMFQMTNEELENWKSQIATSNKEIMGLRKLPFVFTEQGVSMLSAVLKSQTAVQTSIQIIKSFVSMRSFLQKHNAQYPKIEIEKFVLSHDRFLIIDDVEVYHFGASLKDLGKKWFAVSKLDINSFELLGKLK